ncbi:MAG: Ca-activated chloride channel family protein, partial [Saprospiraceae bacterium]
MKLLNLLFAILFCSTTIFSQTSIYGKVTDESSGEDLIYANIVLNRNGVFAAGTLTDFEGNYSVPVDPGTYEVNVSYTGYPNRAITDIIVKAGQGTKLDIQLSEGIDLSTVIVTGYKVPIIEQDNSTQGATLTSEQMKNLPRKNISALAGTTAGLSQVDNSEAVTVRGSRDRATNYYIDGIRVSGSANLIERDKTSIVKNDLLGETPSAYENKANLISQNIAKSNISYKEEKLITEPISANEEYDNIDENDFIKSEENNFSTFSIDVDYASYSNIRRFINQRQTPPRAAVRIEEMVNYFNYDYPQPTNNKPFSVNTELGDCPWNNRHKLLHVGLQGEDMSFEKATSNNIVFLIDVSGSMSSANKLPLLKQSFALLINELRPEDRVAIAVYAGAAGLVLPSTPVKEKATILNALNKLNAGGSTAGGAGIQLAYKVALENLMAAGNNRVILATDGDFNVGTSSPDDLEKLIEEKRQSGVYLTVLGFGMGNYKDNRLEVLADKGNGHYAYIDNLKEAKKVFITELTGTLYTIAKDVKIQMVFNAKNVK